MHPSLASWNASVQLRRVNWLAHANLFESKLARLAHAVKAFNPNQPRVPAGNPDGGQWTGSGGGGGTSISGARRSGVQFAGGFTADDDGLTVQSFVSANCRGLIHRVLPSEFLGMTIGEVKAAAAGGDAAARRCLKLLGRDIYRK